MSITDIGIACGLALGMFAAFKTSSHSALNQVSAKSDEAAYILKDICREITTLFNSKYNFYVGPLKPLNNPNILKNLVMVEDKESCTINKKIIHLCTKDPQSGKLYDKNTLIFVFLHELAHVLCEEIGHTENFVKINTALLNYAIQNKIYDPSKPFVKNYCSIST